MFGPLSLQNCWADCRRLGVWPRLHSFWRTSRNEATCSSLREYIGFVSHLWIAPIEDLSTIITGSPPLPRKNIGPRFWYIKYKQAPFFVLNSSSRPSQYIHPGFSLPKLLSIVLSFSSSPRPYNTWQQPPLACVLTLPNNSKLFNLLSSPNPYKTWNHPFLSSYPSPTTP